MVSGSGGDSKAMASSYRSGREEEVERREYPNQTLLLPLLEGANASKQGFRVGALAAHR